MMHYPTKEQVENAIRRARAAGREPTPSAVADEIERGCGLRPGDDVTASLIKHFKIVPSSPEYAS